MLGADPAPDAKRDLGPLGHALAMQAYLAVQSNDIDGAKVLLDRAAVAASGSDDPTLTVRSQLLSGICDVQEGQAGSRDATLAILQSAHENFDEIYSSGYSNLTYLDVEQRRLRQASDLLGFTLPLTIERDLPICRVWQQGSRGRMKLLRGDWADAVADADDVLDGPSAPLARTWPHLVRGLVALRSGGDPDADLEEAWRLARRFGEPIRLLPAAAALVERSWLRGVADPREDECRAALTVATGAGLEWARGELLTWLRRLDEHSGPTAEPDGDLGAGGPAVPAGAGGALRGGGRRCGRPSRPRTSRRSRWWTPARPTARGPGSTCSIASAPTRWPPRSARTCGARGRR